MNIHVIIFFYLLLDLVWITSNYKMYNNAVVKIQRTNIKSRVVPAILAYVLLLLNIYYILIPYTKRLRSRITRIAIFALSGLVIYGVYNATTYAIIINYPLHVAVIDSLWGMVSHTALALAIEYMVSER